MSTNLPDINSLFYRCDSTHDFINDSRFYNGDIDDDTKKGRSKSLIETTANTTLDNAFPLLKLTAIDAMPNIDDQSKSSLKQMIDPNFKIKVTGKRKQSTAATLPAPVVASNTSSLSQHQVVVFLNVNVGDFVYVLFYDDFGLRKSSVSVTGINNKKNVTDMFVNDTTQCVWYLAEVVNVHKQTFDENDYYRYIEVDLKYAHDSSTKNKFRLEEDKYVKSENVKNIQYIQENLWYKPTQQPALPNHIDYKYNDDSIGYELSLKIKQLESLKQNTLLTKVSKSFYIKCKNNKILINAELSNITIRQQTFVIEIKNTSRNPQDKIFLYPFNYKKQTPSGWSMDNKFEAKNSEASLSYVQKTFNNFLLLYYNQVFLKTLAFDSETRQIIKILESSGIAKIFQYRVEKQYANQGCSKLFTNLGIHNWQISIDDTNITAISTCFKSILMTTANFWDSSLASQQVKKNVEYDTNDLDCTKQNYKNILSVLSTDKLNWSKISIKNNVCVFKNNLLDLYPVNDTNEYEEGFEFKFNIFKTVALLKHQIINLNFLNLNVTSLQELTMNDAMNIKRSGDGFQVAKVKELQNQQKNVVIMTKDLFLFTHCFIKSVPCICISERDELMLLKICHIPLNSLGQLPINTKHSLLDNSILVNYAKRICRVFTGGSVENKQEITHEKTILNIFFDKESHKTLTNVLEFPKLSKELTDTGIIPDINETEYNKYLIAAEFYISQLKLLEYIKKHKAEEIDLNNVEDQLIVVLHYMELCNIYYGDLLTEERLHSEYAKRDQFKYLIIVNLLQKDWQLIDIMTFCWDHNIDIQDDDVKDVINQYAKFLEQKSDHVSTTSSQENNTKTYLRKVGSPLPRTLPPLSKELYNGIRKPERLRPNPPMGPITGGYNKNKKTQKRLIRRMLRKIKRL